MEPEKIPEEEAAPKGEAVPDKLLSGEKPHSFSGPLPIASANDVDSDFQNLPPSTKETSFTDPHPDRGPNRYAEGLHAGDTGTGDITPGRNPQISRLLQDLRRSYSGNSMEQLNPMYKVSLPPTPDYQVDGTDGYPSPLGSTGPQDNFNSYASSPLPPWRIPETENRIVANTIFTGGFRNDPRGHIMMTNDHRSPSGGPSLDPKVGPRSARCSRDGCDGLVMRDDGGNEFFPCLCQYKICRDCYKDALQEESGACPGCKEVYRAKNQFSGGNEEDDEDSEDYEDKKSIGQLSREDDQSGSISSRSLKTGSTSQATRNLGDFSFVCSVDRYSHASRRDRRRAETLCADQTHCVDDDAPLAVVKKEERDMQMLLYGDSKAEYGYGSAVWPKASSEKGFGGDDDDDLSLPKFEERSNRPLCRKAAVSLALISPYRVMVGVRLVVLVLFLWWRFTNPTPDAVWLWMASVICETWFGFSWILDQFPKLNPVNRHTDLSVLSEKFEGTSASNGKAPTSAAGFLCRSQLPGVDVFVSTADPEKEPVLTTANTVLSILAANYPVEKIAVYVSDDGGALLTFEALAETASFARVWIPFCRKHNIDLRCPEYYFQLRGDPTKGRLRPDFVRDRRRVKRDYDEFKVRINGLPDAIRRRSEDLNSREELRLRLAEIAVDPAEHRKPQKATWMTDGSKWPGTWNTPHKDHSRNDHSGIIQVLLAPPHPDPRVQQDVTNLIDVGGVDTRLPLLVYVSREKRPGYDHNKKAGAMNALIRTSAIMSNGAFILNLDCDHYVNNADAMREAMCFMMARGGEKVCFVQFPQRFEGIDPNDRYANNNTVFFDINMRGLDGIQGPFYAGTGCVFRRTALYGMDPPNKKTYDGNDRGCCLPLSCCCCCCGSRKKSVASKSSQRRSQTMTVLQQAALKGHTGQLVMTPSGESIGLLDEDHDALLLAKEFGQSLAFLRSIPEAEEAGMPLGQGHRGLVDENGRTEDGHAGRGPVVHPPLDAETVADAILVISSWYEDKTEWGRRLGWIYGSVTEDVVTGYRMHNRGWKSVYAHPSRPAFKGTAPINLTDRLHQVLRWATGSVEIFFSRNNAFVASGGLKCLQRVAYLNVGIYPFTSIFLTVYCFLPAICLFTDKFITPTPISLQALIYIFALALATYALAVMEVRWSGVTLEEWWRNEQFWVIGGTSAHLAAVYQGLLKVVAGVDISFTLTSKSADTEDGDPYADLHLVKWTSLMIPPLTIMMVNIIACVMGISRTVYSLYPRWSDLLGKMFFSLWVLLHLYPFAKGLMGKRNKTPTIIFVWSGLLSVILSLIWTNISPPEGSLNAMDSSFSFP